MAAMDISQEAPAAQDAVTVAAGKKGGKGQAHAGAPHAELPEKRVDPGDGHPYTKEEFQAWYGGAEEWEAAVHAASADRVRGRVDDWGNFLPHPGVSIVCPVLPYEGWVRLPGAIMAVAGRWVTPLPVGCYHATLSAGPSQAKLWLNGEAWLTFLRQRRAEWQSADATLTKAKLAPRSLHLTSLRDPAQGWGIVANFTADKEDNNRAQDLRVAVHASAPDCGFEVRERPWSVTLAYPRRASGIMPPAVFRTVQGLVEATLAKAPLPLGPARLCFSPNAAAFMPWDGTIAEEPDGIMGAWNPHMGLGPAPPLKPPPMRHCDSHTAGRPGSPVADLSHGLRLRSPRSRGFTAGA